VSSDVGGSNHHLRNAVGGDVLMNWRVTNWEAPMLVKVLAVSTAICIALVVVVGGVILAINWVYENYGENVAAGVFFGVLGFVVVSLFTWMIMEEL